MELYEYPRPKDDTGIGIHWRAGSPAAVGLDKIRQYWIPELKEMGIKWVKIANHQGALPFVELLLAEDFMPIVRLYRPAPNPGHLDEAAHQALDAFVRVGVSYFEFNNEPDMGEEWQSGTVPAHALETVAENAIIDMETILERGGMPAVPAVSTGSQWDIVGKIVEKGRADLFDGPVWQAIHNYARNHPLDYPYDLGNQEGSPYTQEFYRALANERWDGDAWQDRSLQAINRLRRERCNPGATLQDDAGCWLAYEYFNALNRRHLGRSLPILSTENGYLVGEDADPRYPATTPDLHMAQTLEACRVMMSTSKRFRPAPDYYFCTAFWLLGNYVLGDSSPWEEHAWYSGRWPGGTLPLVPALKHEPKRPRQLAGGEPIRCRLQGAVLNGPSAEEGQPTLVLERGRADAPGEGLEAEVARTTVDASRRYTFADLAPGRYTVRLLDASGQVTAARQEVSIGPGEPTVHLNFDLAASDGETTAPSESAIQGRVRGGASVSLLLVHKGDGKAFQTMSRMDGTFHFVDLPAGDYCLRVLEPRGIRLDHLELDGRNSIQVELAVAGWGHTVRDVGKSPGFGVLRCSVEGHKDVVVRARASGWRGREARTGSKPEYGEYACEIAPLRNGEYQVEVEGVTDESGAPLTAPVFVDSRTVTFVEFVHSEIDDEPPPQTSSIAGRVINGSGLTIVLTDSFGRRQEQTVDDDERYAFTQQAPGVYILEVMGWEAATSHPRLALDGSNQLRLDLLVPTATGSDGGPPEGPAQSVIAGIAPGATGQTATLTDQYGRQQKASVAEDDRFRFASLPAGEYDLQVPGGYRQAGLKADGQSGWEVRFAPLEKQWIVETQLAGNSPGFGVVQVQVIGRPDLPVHIWAEGGEGLVQETGSKPEYGQYALEFSPLEAGEYVVEPEGLGVRAQVVVTRRDVVVVTFQRGGQASGPTIVRPLYEPSLSE